MASFKLMDLVTEMGPWVIRIKSLIFCRSSSRKFNVIGLYHQIIYSVNKIQFCKKHLHNLMGLDDVKVRLLAKL